MSKEVERNTFSPLKWNKERDGSVVVVVVGLVMVVVMKMMMTIMTTMMVRVIVFVGVK